MGLIDKFKDLFTDEEEIEENNDNNKEETVKIKEIKKEDTKKIEKTEEHKLPTFMRKKIEQEENVKKDISTKQKVDELEKKQELNSRVSNRINNNLYTEDTVEIPSLNDNAFKFPIEFDDNDFIPSRAKREIDKNEEKDISKKEEVYIQKTINTISNKAEKKVADLYKDKQEEKVEQKFKATPIISPIYGVLDKNYSKDEIKEKDQDSYEIKRNSVEKGIDFESVRKKAYGTLSDDIKDNINCDNCEFKKNAKQEKKEIDKDNLVYEVLKEDEIVNNSKKEDITFGDATENYYDYGVEYEIPKRSTKKVKETQVDESIKIVDTNNNTVSETKTKKEKKEIPPVKSNINLLSTLKKSMGNEEKEEKKDLELTDDLFNMIDSMYDERND